MGYIKLNAIIVTGHECPDGEKRFQKAHEKAKEIFNGDDERFHLVTEIRMSPNNGYLSFFIAPDGGKAGWDISEEFKQKRKEFTDYIYFEPQFSFIDLAYDEEGHLWVEKSNEWHIPESPGDSLEKYFE